MPYDGTKNPYHRADVSPESYGTIGRNVAVSASPMQFATYAYVRVRAPATSSTPVVKYLPAQNADGAYVTMTLTPGVAEFLPHLVREIAGTALGTSADLEILTSER